VVARAAKEIELKVIPEVDYEPTKNIESYLKFQLQNYTNQEISDENVTYELSTGTGNYLVNSSWNKKVLDKEYPKLTGDIVGIDWDTNENSKGTPIQIALSAKNLWESKVLPSIKDGTVISNYPQGGAWGARDRAYQRMGFSPIGQNGYQFAIKENGKLRPFNVEPVPDAIYTSKILQQRLAKADEIRNRKIAAGEDPGPREPYEVSLEKAKQTVMEKYGDWRAINS
jgi:hypothetical protein